MIYVELFWTFLQVGAFSFGGGYGMIALIRELNPNVQIILTTHSPAMIMDGWMDAVTEVSDITE